MNIEKTKVHRLEKCWSAPQKADMVKDPVFAQKKKAIADCIKETVKIRRKNPDYAWPAACGTPLE